MKRIERGIIEEKVKKAYKEGCQWAGIDWGYTYAIMLDTSNADVWVDTFADENSWKEYRDEAVVRLTEYGRAVKESEISLAKEAVAYLTGAGWEVED